MIVKVNMHKRVIRKRIGDYKIIFVHIYGLEKILRNGLLLLHLFPDKSGSGLN